MNGQENVCFTLGEFATNNNNENVNVELFLVSTAATVSYVVTLAFDCKLITTTSEQQSRYTRVAI